VERLRREALSRPIRVCAYGPCALEIAREAWLCRVDQHADRQDRAAIFKNL
jgi:hypothetical protein